MTATLTKPALERAKLEAEIRKLTADAEKAECDRDIARWALNEQRASGDHAHVYTFFGAVGHESVYACIKNLAHWARRDPGSAITVVFNSPGGSIIDGLALFDYLVELRHAGHRIETVALGMAASMAGVLLQAGSNRVMGTNSHLLIHEAAAGTWGKVSEMEDQVAFVLRLQERCSGILAERSTLSELQIKRRWRKKDWWLGAGEALELGFVDEIR